MKTLLILLFFFCNSTYSEVEIDLGHKTVQIKGIPSITYSATYKVNTPKRKYVTTQIISILNDGSCFLKIMKDHRNDRSLPKEKRIFQIKNYDPKPLKEDMKASLKEFFEGMMHWTLKQKSFLALPKKQSGVYLAQLSLSYQNEFLTCYISSSEKHYEPLSIEGEQLIQLINHIILWIKKEQGDIVKK